MRTMKETLRGLRRTTKRLRSLVRDEDHDKWYDEHTDKHDRPPNITGPWSQGGG
ncbi:hypothetical protein GCM10025782_02070 [Pedococcus ginsenosidimutans]|jgi:hypothetical protein|uniref:Uncharacterized protein n=1 Tax=Pedococcus ginsenosidimutans TaxID=490570 RepID=A0ABP8XM94_9MICO